MAPRSLAEALQSEAPLFQGHHYDSGDEEYDPVLHAPPKMRRKSRSVSTSSYDSGHVSVPDDEASEDGVPSSTSRRSSVHSAGFPEDRSDLHDPVPGLAKTSSSSFKKAPHAVDLLETDDHVIKKAVGKSKQPTNPKGWDSSPALSAPSGFTAGGVPAFKLMSKREQAHRKEAPTWGGPPEAIEVLNRTPATHRNRRDSSVVSQGHGNNDNINFDATTGEGYDMTVLAYNTRGKLNLMSQTAEIQAVARSAIDKTYVSIITVNAYPDLGKRKQVVLDACVRAAEELGPRYQRILDLLQDDTQTEFRKAVGDIPDGRISTLRRDIKTIASGHCVGHYGLRQDCETYVTNLLDAQRYVFAGEHVADRVNYKLPWRQHAIAAVIRQVFFTGKNNFVNSHPCLFCTTIEGLDDQPEVPAGMVALVCTAIHACIAEWSTGKHVEEEFSGSEWAGTYRIHKMMLDHVREKEPLFFHETMHYIYKQADSSTRNGSSAESKQPNALALMDLSALA
ncbi:hypothetical protein GLOTRDRAFT_134644 [Gloeophyllum trabeum ATCC 11539]|uniref:DUF6532 domain-containing protein n=2 Tax=Gloeophyllum trabeum (strain ATCC 11539 / FP-39264 / Madison 617) TaxID=670483 RepID=S7PQL9_GLOTA|nr:uncharacterized protein GLOTRDRAFT_134644 [Gloeophyllum trabeum ATCC 11539]EPQ49763.1 hypothetical protein GLOTRDRAFT_134644 [Gloeophyllum trabeum ATCC 11539]